MFEKLLQKECLHCKEIIYKPVNESLKNWSTRHKYCSKACFDLYRKGKPFKHSKQFKKGHVPANKDKKDPASSERMKLNNPMKRVEVCLKSSLSHKGKTIPIEQRMKMSLASKRVVAEGRHNFYIDGRNSLNQAIRHSIEYKLWREAVFKRDNYTCQECGCDRSGELEAHHIKPFSLFPELRTAIDNGVTLCKVCHQKTDTYPKQLKTLLINS